MTENTQGEDTDTQFAEQLEGELEQLDQNNKTRKSIDQIYLEIGNGRYQKKVTMLFALHYVLNSIFLLTPGIFFQMPIFLCDGVVCDQKKYCSTDPKLREISPDSDLSITKEFELYCSKDYMNSIGESMPFAGGLIGLLIFMYIADNKGRKITIGITWAICTLGGILLISFANIYTIFIGFFLVGFGQIPACYIDLVVLSEISTGEFRSVSTCFMYVAFGVSELLIWPLNIAVNNWRWFNLWFLTIPYLLLNAIYFFIHESPKFMHPRSLKNTAEILNKMAIENGKENRYEAEDIQIIDTANTGSKKYNYIDAFRYRSARSISFALFGLSLGIHALYYGMQISLDLISSNVAKNSFYVGIADTFGYIISDIVCPRFKRKIWLNITLFVTSILCFSFLIDEVPLECQVDGASCIQKTINIVQAVTARFIISFSFSFMVMWMNELYPTSIRSIGVGLVAAVGLFGAQITPYIKQLCQKIDVNTIAVLGVFGVLACLSTFGLKETFKQPLLEEIPELTRRFSVKKSKSFHNEDMKYIKDIRKQYQLEQKKQKTSFQKKAYFQIENSLNDNQIVQSLNNDKLESF